MERLKRSLFFWALVLLFLITAPVIVLNARGYRFDISRGVFVFSGSVSFKSNPQTVDVKLNNELIGSKKLNMINNSYNLTGLLPGDYNIEISASGFQTWSKKADVHSGIASEFWNVLLAKTKYEKTDNNLSGVHRFFISPRNRHIAYTANSEQGLAVKIFNISSKISDNSLDFPEWEFIEDERKENIEWSPDETYISIPVRQTLQNPKNNKNKTQINYKYDYFIADWENNSSFNLGQFLNMENIHNVRWDPEKKGYLFFSKDGYLYKANMKDAADIIEIAAGISAYDLSYSGVYYIQSQNNLIFKKSLDGKSNPVQITSDFPHSENPEIDKIIVYDESRIAFIAKNKDLYIFNKGEHNNYFKKLGGGIEGFQFSNDGKKALFWANNEIFAYFLRDWKVQPTRVEDETQNITRYSEPISNVQWFSDYEHIIFNSGKWAKIIELDPRGCRNTMDLFGTTIENPFIIYNDYLEKLYFTDTKENATSMYSIDFPEKTSLLGITGLGR